MSRFGSLLSGLGPPVGPEIKRRDFLKLCTVTAAAMGLPASVGAKMAEAAASGPKPPVIWLSFQECTGCTESLLRVGAPDLGHLILDLISLDYHEALCAPAGFQVEKSLHDSMTANEGKYVCVMEGAIPTKDDGIYCKIAGKTAVDIAKEVGGKSAAIVAIGSCASWGGIPSADPNPTGAVGVNKIVTDKPVVTIPGCPPNAYNFLGTVLHFLTFGALPELDELGRPKWAYGRPIHEHCPRRAHFDAGRFAEQFGDEGHRSGYCLYKLGCKGPETHINCSVQHFADTPDAWPIGGGHPCVGCSEQKLAFRVPMHQTANIERPMPPDTYPPIHGDHSNVGPVATGVGGLIVGGLLGAGYMASKKLQGAEADEPPKKED
jgi:hydrogenase small subunit